jgi:hypothetical protein
VAAHRRGGAACNVACRIGNGRNGRLLKHDIISAHLFRKVDAMSTTILMEPDVQQKLVIVDERLSTPLYESNIRIHID